MITLNTEVVKGRVRRTERMLELARANEAHQAHALRVAVLVRAKNWKTEVVGAAENQRLQLIAQAPDSVLLVHPDGF